MKKSLVVMLVVATGFGFAADYRAPQNGEKVSEVADSISALLEKAPAVVEKVASTVETLTPNKSHIYLRMNAIEPNPARTARRLVPGIGFGYRRTVGNSAVDFSTSYSRGRSAQGGKNEFITLPKVAYFYYLSPLQTASIYGGPAIALGRIKSSPGNLFEGLIPSATVGYEMSRRANLLSFLQLDVSFPVVASRLKGPLPGVIAELAFGAGF